MKNTLILGLIFVCFQSVANIEKLQIDTVFSSVETTMQDLKKTHNRIIMCKSRECLCSNLRRKQQGRNPVICSQTEQTKNSQIIRHGDIFKYCKPCSGISQKSLSVSLDNLTNRNMPALKEEVRQLTASYNSLQQKLNKCNVDLRSLKAQK